MCRRDRHCAVDLTCFSTICARDQTIHINCGAAADVKSSSTGILWMRDRFGSGDGRVASCGASCVKIRGSPDQFVYDTMVYDPTNNDHPISYSFTAGASGCYSLTMFFAETYAPAARVGGRVFDVYVNGMLALDKFDTYASAGNEFATQTTRTHDVFSATGQQIVLELRHGPAENPAISGLRLRYLGPQCLSGVADGEWKEAAGSVLLSLDVMDVTRRPECNWVVRKNIPGSYGGCLTTVGDALNSQCQVAVEVTIRTPGSYWLRARTHTSLTTPSYVPIMIDAAATVADVSGAGALRVHKPADVSSDGHSRWLLSTSLMSIAVTNTWTYESRLCSTGNDATGKEPCYGPPVIVFPSPGTYSLWFGPIPPQVCVDHILMYREDALPDTCD